MNTTTRAPGKHNEQDERNTHGERISRTRRTAGWAAAGWAAAFGVFHVYWALGGSLGLGDGPGADKVGEDPAFLAYDLVVAVLCFVGAGVAVALAGGPRPAWATSRAMRLLGWAALLVLLLRGLPGLTEEVLRATGILPNGFLNMSDQDVYGEPDPSTYTVWSLRAVDLYFVLGSLLFGATLWRGRDARAR